jgi:type IV secretion system protein VirD4
VTNSEQLYVAIAAALAAVLAAIWIVGGVAGAVFGGGWPAVDAADLAAIALRLPSHLGEPRAAWPAGARATLPGAAGIYSSGVLVAGLVVGIVVVLHRVGISAEAVGLRSRRQVPTARWATRRDLAPLRVSGPQPGRLILGRSGRNLIAAQERQSVIVFAPTGTHKTSGLAIPILLEWEGPVLVTSVKGDLVSKTIDRREELGDVMVFDPSGVSGVEPAHRWSPLWTAATWRGAQRMAHWLCGAAQVSKSGLQDADFWFATAEKLISPLLFAAATSRRTMADVVRWLDEGPELSEAEVCKALKEAGEEGAERAWLATQNREEKQRSSVYTTAETVVAAFADPQVQHETEAADYTPEHLLNGKCNTLYLCSPLQEQERLRAVFSALTQEFLVHAYEKASAGGGQLLEPAALLLLDEAANIAPLATLDTVASTAASLGIQLVTVFQDMAQIRTVYGDRSPTIVNNHWAKLLGIGLSDPETLSWVSRVTGATEVDQRSRSTGDQGRRSVTEGETYRDLTPANVVRERDPGSALLIYHNLPPAKLDLRLWFEDKPLRRLQAAEGESQRTVTT